MATWQDLRRRWFQVRGQDLDRTVALYVTTQQGRLRPRSLLRRLSSIAIAHRTAGHPSPTGAELVRRAVAGLRRKHGAAPPAKARSRCCCVG